MDLCDERAEPLLAIQARGVVTAGPKAGRPAAGRTGAAKGATRPTGAWAVGRTMGDVQAAIEAARSKQ